MYVSLLFGAKANDRAKNVEINEKAPRTCSHLEITGPWRKATLDGTRTILLEK